MISVVALPTLVRWILRRAPIAAIEAPAVAPSRA